MENELTIIPVLNKIDLPAADPERRAEEIEKVIGMDSSEIIAVSAKTGQNVEDVLQAVIDRIDSPIEFTKKHPNRYNTA
jgi:GTP-binding protein LepA